MVNNAIPAAKTIIPAFTLPSGITPPTRPAITPPTPASVKTAPRLARSIGSILKGPTVERRRSESLRKTPGRFSLERSISIKTDTTMPAPTPTIAPRSGRKTAKIMAKTPMDRAGIKIFIPMVRYFSLVYSSVSGSTFPIFTFFRMAGMVIRIISAPFIAGGIQRPNASTAPRAHQNSPVPNREGFSLSNAFLIPV